MLNRKYIAPLDGMRAIAILCVLFFHINERYLSGGFIGVDIFFVISGYIISRNILADRASGRFSFRVFYQRRAARLLPSVVVTVASSLIVAYFIYPEGTAAYFSRVGLYALISLANIFFYLNTGYFDASAESNIFLHTWSLSVEEQFYLLWPCLLLAMTGLRQRLLAALSAIALIGAACSWWLYRVDAAAAFFLMPARVFQFSAGAAVAVYHLRAERQMTLSSSLAFTIGIALMMSSAILADGDQYDFLVAAILPTIGAAIAILHLDAPAAHVLLGNRVATFVGKRAYTVYLVHWPVIVMSSLYFGHSRPVAIDIGLFVASFVLGELLHRGVEQPFRFGAAPFAANRAKGRWVVAAAATATITALAYWTSAMPTVIIQDASSDGNPSLSYTQFVRDNHELRMQLGRYKEHCILRPEEDYSAYNYASCMRGDGDPKLLIIGDSMAGEANIMLSKALPKNVTLVAGVAGCAVSYPLSVPQASEACVRLNKERLEWAKRDDIVAIAIITQWHWQTREQIASLLEYLRDIGKPVIVFGARPSVSTEVPTLVDSTAGAKVANDLTGYLQYTGIEKNAEIRTILQPFGSQFLYVDLVELMCGERCAPFTGRGTPIYIDRAHITAPALLEFADIIESKHGDRIRSMMKPQLQDAALRSITK